MTGSTPGMPKQTGQTCELGGAPNLVLHPQKSFDWVRSWTWTSSPTTIWYGRDIITSNRFATFGVLAEPDTAGNVPGSHAGRVRLQSHHSVPRTRHAVYD